MHQKTALPLPKWVMQGYSKAWQRYQDNAVLHSEISKVLGEKHTSIVLCYLKKNGWLEVALDPEDSRKRTYRLKSPEQAVEEIAGRR